MRKRQWAWALLGVLAMLLVLTTTYAMVNTAVLVDLIRQDQQTSVQRNKTTAANTEQIKRVAEQIESCTTPEGECFKRGQARTGAAVASINDVVILAAACAKQPNNVTAAQIRACVVDLLPAPRSTP